MQDSCHACQIDTGRLIMVAFTKGQPNAHVKHFLAYLARREDRIHDGIKNPGVTVVNCRNVGNRPKAE